MTHNNYIFNASARPILVFHLKNDTKKCIDEFEYGLLRYPQLYPLLDALCNKNGRSNPLLNFLDEPLKRDLQFYQLSENDPSGNLILPEKVDLSLGLRLRFTNKKSHKICIQIRKNPETIRWILSQLKKEQTYGYDTLCSDDIHNLIQTGILITEPPPHVATFPIAAGNIINLTATPIDALLSVADPVFIQKSNENMPPPKILNMLGRHIPELPTNKAVLWGSHAGSKMPIAHLLDSKDEAVAANSIKNATHAVSIENEKRSWKKKLIAAQTKYKRNNYVHLKSILPEVSRPYLRQHCRNLVSNNYLDGMNDGQVVKRATLHNEPVTAMHHYRLSKIISSVVGEKVTPSFSLIAFYTGGAVLDNHIDRKQCRFNCSVVYDMFDKNWQDVEPWPIYLQMKKQPRAVNMHIGDGVIYRGNEIPHWREALPDNHFAMVGLYFFVSENFKETLT